MTVHHKNHVSHHTTARAATATPAPAPAPTPAPAPAPVLTARQVKALEKDLKAAGFNPGKVDGKLTANTTKALKQFQAAWGLPATGQLDAKTQAKLDHTTARIGHHKDDQFVSVGQKSKDIGTLERRLQKLGYDTGKADGIYDRQTEAAVKAFRADQKELPDNKAFLAKDSRRVLRQEVSKLSHAPEHTRVKPTREHKRLDGATATAVSREHADGTVGVGLGSQGRSITNIQAHLKAAGFDPKHTTGQFDERTEGAVKAFQQRAGLEVTGRVDSKTWKELKKSFLYAKDSTSPAQRLGERSGAVLRSEKLLQKMGLLKKGQVDGLFDRATLKASRAFERKHGFGKDGAIGEGQLKAMRVEAKRMDSPKLRLVREIAEMAKKRGVPAEIPIMTALVESNFKNVAFGDRDSIGMFQQRAAWGSFAERHDPIKSARLFLDGGHGGQRGASDFISRYRSLGPKAYGQWCQAVQVSAFPERYQQRLAEARRLLKAAGVPYGLK